MTEKPRETISGRPPEALDIPGAPAPINPATGQHNDYWVLPAKERAKGYVRPYRDAYVHPKCGVVTRMSKPLAETYARDPKFYGATFCAGCRMHMPVAEFLWDADRQQVGS